MRKKALLAVIVLGMIILLSATAFTAPPVAQTYDGPVPPPADPTFGNQLPVTGYYEQSVGERTAKVYIPEGTPIRGYFTVITVPAGVDTTEFLDDCGWFDIARERQEGLFILEPQEQEWGTFEEELQYVEDAMDLFMNQRVFYHIFGCHYVVAYGNGSGGSAMEAWVANHPLHVISAVYVDTDGLSFEYLDEVGAQEFGAESDSYANVPYSQVPVPTAFLTDDVEKTSASQLYWINANHNGFEMITSYTDIDKATLMQSWGLNAPYDVESYTRNICDMLLYGYTRYDNTSVYGNVLGSRPDYAALGVDINTFTMEDKSGTSWLREYMVYVPDNAGDVYPDGAPVVYIFPGGSQTDRVFFDATRWWEVADQYGFIIAVLCGQTNAGTGYSVSINSNREAELSDYEYLESVIAQVDEKYDTDPARRFATGQSAGSAFTHNVGYYLSDYFTALGSTSGITNVPQGTDSGVLPFYLILGENDIDSYDLTSERLNAQVAYWLTRNGAADGVLDAEAVKEGRQTTYTWENANGFPVYQYSWTDGRSHNCITDEMWLLWENWFSKWDKNDEGQLLYEGELIGEEEPVDPTIPRAVEYSGPTPPAIDVTLGNQHPVTGYYVQSVGTAGRTAKVYIPEGTSLRDYYTIVAVPDGVDTDEFLYNAGWFALAEERQEGLFILEPANGTWGSFEDEYAYVTAAIQVMGGVQFYSVYGCHYLVGYGSNAGASALEAWAANNPMHVISMAFVDSPGLSAAYLAEVGAKEFGGNVTSPDYPNVPYRDVPVPAWFINQNLATVADSLAYWQAASAVAGSAETNAFGGQTYYQADPAANRITAYSDVKSQVAEWQTAAAYTSTELTRNIYGFLAQYTRYDNTSVYGNVLGVRPDYQAMGVEIKTLQIEDTLNQTWTREYMVYVPDNSATLYPDGAPTVYVHPGNTQSNRVFFDATHWWEVADQYGFILVISCGQYTNNSLQPGWNTSNTTVSATRMNDFEFIKAVVAAVDADYNTDPDRRFATGQSLGSQFTQWLGVYLPEYFTAIGSTSWALTSTPQDGPDSILPVYTIWGEYDNWPHSLTANGVVRSSSSYWLDRNGLADVDSPDSTVVDGRQTTYTWLNEAGIPLYKYSWTAARSHNCIVDEMWILWEDWFSKWDKNDAGTLLYEGNPIDEDVDPSVPRAQEYTGATPPAVDVSLGNQLPVNGYYKQTVTVNSEERTVKVYIPEKAPIRAYFTVIAVPDGVDTDAFLQEAGWFAIADAQEECLFILEPKDQTWGSFETEVEYVKQAIAKMGGNEFYSTFGCHYFVGYGEGAPALEAWAANNPMFVISMAYLDSAGLPAAYLAQAGAIELGTNDTGYPNVPQSDVPVPALFVNADLATPAASLSYWKSANEVVDTPVSGGPLGSSVYYQQAGSDNWVTSYSDVKTQVATLAGTVEYTAEGVSQALYDFLSYYTRYDNTSIYGNVLGVRPHYEEIGATIHFMEIEDTFDQTWTREYIVYVPENSAEKFPEGAPTVYALGGNTQTARVFFDATHWWEVADEYGFILVVPCSQYNNSISMGWNSNPEALTAVRMNDYDWLKAVIAAVDGEYDTDPDRRYVTGQSAGSALTQNVAARMPEYFTAAGPTSAASNLSAVAYTETLPLYLLWGQYDGSGYLLGSGNPRTGLQSWLTRYGLDADLDSENYGASYVGEAEGMLGRQTTYTWCDEDGTPLVRYSWTAGRSHNCAVDEMWLLWENWFSKWDRDAEGNRVFAETSGPTPGDPSIGIDARTEVYVSQYAGLKDRTVEYTISVADVTDAKYFKLTAQFDNEYLTYQGYTNHLKEAGLNIHDFVSSQYDAASGQFTTEFTIMEQNTTYSVTDSAPLLTVSFTVNSDVAAGTELEGLLQSVEMRIIGADGNATEQTLAVTKATAPTVVRLFSHKYDENGDGAFDINDILNIINKYYGVMDIDALWNQAERFDINPDGIIDLMDIIKFYALLNDGPPSGTIAASDVASIQAFTKPNFYGQRLYQVEVTFKSGTDMSAAANKANYALWDRAFVGGQFETGEIQQVLVTNNTATLIFDAGPAWGAVNDDNSPEPFGMLTTSNWAVVNVYDAANNQTGHAISTSGTSYFTREELDLVLCIGGVEFANGFALTDSFGQYQSGGPWLASVHEIYEDYQETALPYAANDTRYLAFDNKVPVRYYVPESYDPATPMTMVVYLTGGGTSYWERFDDNGNFLANNYGTNVTYDNATAAWMDKDVIIVAPNVTNQSDISSAEVADIIRHFQGEYNISQVVGIGNSQGTVTFTAVVRNNPGLVDIVMPNNGHFGDSATATEPYTLRNWTAQDFANLTDNQTKFLLINGEQDGNTAVYGQNTYLDLVRIYGEAGYSDEWIADNIRLYGYQSWKFTEWDVTDHSCIKMTSWNYIDNPYLDVYEGQNPLSAGDTYKLADAPTGGHEFDYPVYAESISEWVLSRETSEPTPGGISLADVESMQAFTMPNFYGQRLYQVEVIFKAGTDMAAAANKANYTIWDRAFYGGAFETGVIEGVTVSGNTATLTFDQEPAVSEAQNDRPEPFGMLVTVDWSVYNTYDSSNNHQGYEISTGGQYFTRENLDLVLAIGSAEQSAGAAMTDGYGHFAEGGLWLASQHDYYGEYEEILLDVVADTSKYRAYENKVPTRVRVPASYDPASPMPLVVYITGSGTSYWERFDDNGNFLANNYGTNVTYDNAAAAWFDKDVIIALPHVTNQTPTSAPEVGRAIQYFKDNYNISEVIVIGNSNGTAILSETIRQFPGLVDAFIQNNGWLGALTNSGQAGTPNQDTLRNWTEEDLVALAESGTAIWQIGGERDPLAAAYFSQLSLAKIIPYYQAAGYSDEWIADNLRISGYKSWKFDIWDVSDHSCIKMTSWYYIDNPYLDVYEGQAALNAGDTYKLADEPYGGQNYDYPVYGDTVSAWALSRSGGTPTPGGISLADVESMQAFTMPNFYGQRLYQVEVTFKAGTDMAAAANKANYTIWDRAFYGGAFESGEIASVTVSGHTATLTFDQGPAVSAAQNDRPEPFGMLVTVDWSVFNTAFDSEGNGTAYQISTSGQYFTRENLDLVLAIGSTEQSEGVALTDGFGHYQAGSVWLETVNDIYDDYAEVMLDVAYNDTRYLAFDNKVPVRYHVPESYAAGTPMPMIIYVTGQGTSYWERLDDSGNVIATNYGTNVTYDNATAAWFEEDVIVVTPHVTNSTTLSPHEVKGVIDYFKAEYNISDVVFIGNSNGTRIGSETLRLYPEAIDAFIVANGSLGSFLSNLNNIDTLSSWTEAELNGLAETGTAVWFFGGEQDSSVRAYFNQPAYNKLRALYAEHGYSQDWLDQHIRISGFRSWKFSEWDVSDHSCIKMLSWNYIDNLYLDVYEGQSPLTVGQTYNLPDMLLAGGDFNFPTYAETVSEWVHSLQTGGGSQPQPGGISLADVESIQAVTVPNFYGQRLSEVIVAFKAGTDMTAAANKANYTIWDRAFYGGEFETGVIEGVTVSGNTATLTFDQDPAVSAAQNDRPEPFGMLSTVDWAVFNTAFDSEGNGTAYEISVSSGGYYFTRENLDLVLAIGSTERSEGAALTDGFGHMAEDGLWLATSNEIMDDYDFAALDVVTESDKYLAFGNKLPTRYRVPASYDGTQALPLVVYVTGQGTSYWEQVDDNGNIISHNHGTNITYDNALAAWFPYDVIIAAPHVTNSTATSPAEVAATIQYFKDNYEISKVLFIGNSNGTVIGSEVLRENPGLVDAYLMNNGRLGNYRPATADIGTEKEITFQLWTDAELAAMVEAGTSVWLINGEQDSAAPYYCQKSYEKLLTLYADADYSAEWIAENLRISAYKSWKFSEWDVTDHSCIKMSSWYYIDDAYLDVDKNVELTAGTKYTLDNEATGHGNNFEYAVYGDSISDWFLGL